MSTATRPSGTPPFGGGTPQPSAVGPPSAGDPALRRGTPPPPAPTAKWIPKRLARLTVDQYEAMVDSDVFTKRDRFVLINGYLVTKVTKKPPHVLAGELLRDELQAIIPAGWRVRTEVPVRIPEYNEPEPDLSLARGRAKDYAHRHPGPADLAWSSRSRSRASPKIARWPTSMDRRASPSTGSST